MAALKIPAYRIEYKCAFVIACLSAFARAFKTVCGASQVQAFAEQLQQRLEAEERTAGPM